MVLRKHTFNICISNIVWYFFISVVKIYGDTDSVIIFFLLLLYGLSIITLSFVFTLFPDHANNIIMHGLMVIIAFAPLNDIILYVDTSAGVKWLISLLSPVALGLGIKEVCVLRPSINLYHYLWGVKRWKAAVFSDLDILLFTSFLFSCNRDSELKRFL